MTVAVRLATLKDISDILAFAKRKLESTNYQPFPFNAVVARRTVKNAMTNAWSRVWIATEDGKVRGFLIGEIGDLPFSHYQSATDLAFLADKGGRLLLDAFVAWCRMRKVARIDMGVSASKVRRGTDRLFSRAGFARSGGMYYQHLEIGP
jgi:hypothetical protein